MGSAFSEKKLGIEDSEPNLCYVKCFPMGEAHMGVFRTKILSLPTYGGRDLWLVKTTKTKMNVPSNFLLKFTYVHDIDLTPSDILPEEHKNKAKHCGKG
ncbi:hypothetical protein KFK09_016304 [Dendrobium nobile]|uniref:Uncharacterized protein n=1 Tax=Dendrobium nobile TaxID=94219 RepID=A0A8T3AYC9_DENNO|nr:hypothetical protein KFK09_016304 [Dendrobium nobile]